MRALASLLVALLAFVAWPTQATAAPSAGVSFDSKKGVSGSSSGRKYPWPELVVGGNALSFISPFQIGAVGYLPKGRFTFQYDRQLSPKLARHWIHVGVGIVFDRGDWENFRLPNDCNRAEFDCGKAGVVGYDLYAGYTHRFFLAKKPWFVPHLKGSLGFSSWALPKVGDGLAGRQQERFKSWTLNVRPGGGFRIFLLDQLGLGMDVNIPIGFLVHTEAPYAMGRTRSGGFLLGFEIMPLTLEYRF